MAEPLVLVPGLDGTGLLYYRQVPLLERRYQVTTHRLRDTAVAIDELVDELHARVNTVAPGTPVTLVGESFGGALALSYALSYPERVKRLVVLNSFPYFAPQGRLWLGYHLLRGTPWGVMRIVRQLTAWRMHSPHTGREELRRFHDLMRATTRLGYLSRLRMLRQYDIRSRLPDLQVPVLYLASDRDHLVPAVEQARLMASQTPRATLRVLEGHGHICLIAPDLDLCTILDEWTARIVSQYAVLDTARNLARAYLDQIDGRHVGGTASQTSLREALGGPLPDEGTDPVQVIEELVRGADAGVVATVGPRYFGFVTGGSIPVTVGADWLASAWDQNGAMYVMSPAVAVLEDIVARWLVELLRLPQGSSVGFVTGCHMANFTCLAAARHEVLRRAGWNVEADGLQRAPQVSVFVGDEVHVSAVGGLRMLGFGTDELVRIPVDGQGRMSAASLEAAMARATGPVIVCAQVGNVSTGASDPVGRLVDIAHAHHAWVHVDGAFGLWAAAVPGLSDQVSGVERADSWATDAHKWLNVPYDSGLAIVADPAPHRAAMGLRASYLQRGDDEERVGMDWVPESSRRSRVIPLYALLRTLGARGVRDLVARTCDLAKRMAAQLAAAPGVRVLNEVVLNQVLVQFDGADGIGTDEATRAVVAAVQAEGTCWAGGAVWQGRHAMRISVSNWSTTEADIDRSAEVILGCHRSLVADVRPPL